MKRRDLTGLVFGRLTVVADAGKKTVCGHRFWLCRCICGTERMVVSHSLTAGLTQSCGCLNREVVVRMRTIHGEAGGAAKRQSAEYRTLHLMIQRCHNPSNPAYADYGGRGIKVCDKWRNDVSAFVADVGRKPSPQHSIDRFPDNNGHYEPGNVRWATRTEQQNNTSRNRRFEFMGEILTIAEWGKRTGLGIVLYQRVVTYGWPFEEAIVAPKGQTNSKRLTANWATRKAAAK